MAKVTHKREECIGCGACASIAPDYWSINESDGKADLKDAVKNEEGLMEAQIDESAVSENMSAQDSCPVSIIKVEE